MKQIYTLVLLIFTSTNICEAQTFLNGSFENTTSNGCNYGRNNGLYNGLMQNSTAYGAYESIDIQILSCYIPSVPDGTYAVAIANNPSNNTEGEAISLELSSPLTSGNSYTISFDAFSITNFGPQGNLLIGCSESSTDFGTEIYNATTVDGQWTTFSFTFNAPNNGLHITIMPAPGISSWNSLDNFSIETSLSTPNYNNKRALNIFPNPSSHFIQISQLNINVKYSIYSILGKKLLSGNVSTENQKIHIQNIPNGVYFLKLDNGNTFKFLKK